MPEFIRFDPTGDSAVTIRNPEAKFSLGEVGATRAVIAVLPHDEIFVALMRHQSGDWGDIPEKYRDANNRNLVEGQRVLSCYMTASGEQFFIYTEGNRSNTKILLPGEWETATAAK